MKIRHEAKKAFARADSSARFAKAMLRKAAPLVRDYRVRDLISFQRERIRYGIARKRWSSASRIIGFEGQKVCWVICEGVPYCVATDRMRPANESEALAYQYLHDHENPMLRGQRQSFVDHAIQPRQLQIKLLNLKNLLLALQNSRKKCEAIQRTRMTSCPYLELFVEILNSVEPKSDHTVSRAIYLSKH
jgi:hypothetical protein